MILKLAFANEILIHVRLICYLKRI